jgi:hypothetical protein
MVSTRVQRLLAVCNGRQRFVVQFCRLRDVFRKALFPGTFQLGPARILSSW